MQQASSGHSNRLGELIIWQMGTVYHIGLRTCFVGVYSSCCSIPVFPQGFIAGTGWLLQSTTPGSLGRQDSGLLPMILFALLVCIIIAGAETSLSPLCLCLAGHSGHCYLSGKSSLSSVCRNEFYSKPSSLRSAEQMADGMGLR